jgi:hypothetical protein
MACAGPGACSQQSLRLRPRYELGSATREPCLSVAQGINEVLSLGPTKDAVAVPLDDEPEGPVNLNAPLAPEAGTGALVDDRCGRVDLGPSEGGGLPNIAGAGAKDSGVFGEDGELLQSINSNDLEPVESPNDLQLDVQLCASIELTEDGFRDEAISVRGDPLQPGELSSSCEVAQRRVVEDQSPGH